MSVISRQRGYGRPFGRASAIEGRPIQAARPTVAATPIHKPREWRYQTRPSFKRVRGPLVDVFNEAEEVLIVVDLGGFTRGEILLSMTPRQYVLRAVRGEQRFEEAIALPSNVDLERAREHLVNGVLEIVLPRKGKGRAAAAGRRGAKQR